MLDENLPTFRFKPDNPLSTILYFSQHGAEPSPEYILRRADPAQPASRNKYAIALCSSFSPDVVYAEVVVEPEWTQPTLSAAEIRAQGGATPAPVPTVPDSLSILLYNPDQTVALKLVPGGWGKSDSWEFELPTQTFKMPTTSELDRQQQRGPSPSGGPAELVPRIMFRWKKDGRLTKDMTCYMTGKSVGGKKSKEPDITVALFKAGKDSSVTIYEPNLQRVEVEDMKGLEVVLLLAAEAIRDLYLTPRQDIFNSSGAPSGVSAAAAPSGGSRPLRQRAQSNSPVSMSGALGNLPPSANGPTNGPANANAAPAGPAPSAAGPSEPDAETRRLRAMVEQEERERSKREKAEQKRIKKMIEEEEKERRKRDAEVAKETERLRREYGLEGQELPSSRNSNNNASSSGGAGRSPPLPPRRWGGGGGGPGAGFGLGGPPPMRPVSVGPVPAGQPQFQYAPPPTTAWDGGPGGPSGGGSSWQNPAASMSTFFGRGRSDDAKKKMQKKRSSHW